MKQTSMVKNKYTYVGQLSEKRQVVIDTARELIGVPFLHQGRDPSKGLDCAGVIIIPSSKVMSKTVHDLSGYNRRPDGQQLVQCIESQAGKRKAKNKMIPGDIALFAVGNNRQHLGMVGIKNGDLTIIHAVDVPKGRKYRNAGGVVEHRVDDEIYQKIICVYEIPGVDEDS